MTMTRTRTIAALVASVLVLLTTAGAAIAVVASGDDGSAFQRQSCSTRFDDDSDRRGLPFTGSDPGDRCRGGSMMGDGDDGYGWMMGPGRAGQDRTDGWFCHPLAPTVPR